MFYYYLTLCVCVYVSVWGGTSYIMTIEKTGENVFSQN